MRLMNFFCSIWTWDERGEMVKDACPMGIYTYPKKDKLL